MTTPPLEPLDLTHDDYAELRASPAVRARVIDKIARQYRARNLTTEARQLAEEILRMATRDAAEQVRRSIAETLKDFDGLPRDIALTLAHDLEVVNIALPVIAASDVFTDQDLLEIIATACPQRQEAIAGKKRLSEAVTNALIASGFRNVMLALTANPCAHISEAGHHAILDRFSDDTRITENLALRPTLPPSFAERLIHLVSENLKEYILAHHSVPRDTAERIVRHTREKATLYIVRPGTPASHIERMVRHLAVNQRLTDSLILRTLCSGNIRFFEFALAERSKLPVTNIRRVLASGQPAALEKLYAKSRLSERLFPLLHGALAVYFDAVSDLSEENSERFSRRVMERLLTHFPDPHTGTFDRLLETLEHCSPASASAG